MGLEQALQKNATISIPPCKANYKYFNIKRERNKERAVGEEITCYVRGDKLVHSSFYNKKAKKLAHIKRATFR